MNDRSAIICSESGIDAKDKKAMGEESEKSVVTQLPIVTGVCDIDEKTLADLIKNSRTFLANDVTIPTGLDNSAFIIEQQTYCYATETLRRDWVIPNQKTLDEIESGNKNNYIFICCSLNTPNVTTLVLCDIKKNLYTDGSYKLIYNPVSAQQLNRMPE